MNEDVEKAVDYAIETLRRNVDQEIRDLRVQVEGLFLVSAVKEEPAISSEGRGFDDPPSITRGMRQTCLECRHLYFVTESTSKSYCETCLIKRTPNTTHPNAPKTKEEYIAAVTPPRTMVEVDLGWGNPGDVRNIVAERYPVVVNGQWKLEIGKSMRFLNCIEHNWVVDNDAKGCSKCKALEAPTQGRCIDCKKPRGCLDKEGVCRFCRPNHLERSPMLNCKVCNEEIYWGNCCGEVCTKEWLASIEKAHRDKSKGRRFCKKCGAAHEMKSNHCAACVEKPGAA